MDSRPEKRPRGKGDADTADPPNTPAGGGDSSPWETVPSNERPDPTRPPPEDRAQQPGKQSPPPP